MFSQKSPKVVATTPKTNTRNEPSTAKKEESTSISAPNNILNLTQYISSRNNKDTSVGGIPEYIRNTLLETTTPKVDLDFKPFYNIPARTYGGPSSYEAPLFYEQPPEQNDDAEIYEFNDPPQNSGSGVKLHIIDFFI